MKRHKNDIRREGNDDACKLETVPSENVELCLEVEMDDEVRELMKSPEKCLSALLDVTVIKPKGLEPVCERQTLKSDQVRKLIASMKLDAKDKKELMKKLFGDDEKPTRNKFRSGEPPTNLDQGDVDFIYEKQGDVGRCEQIFTTPKTIDNVRSIFACKNKVKEEEPVKLEEACLCKNCAIVGILTDSQKRPFITENMPDPRDKKEVKFEKPQRKKSVSFKQSEDHSIHYKTHLEYQAIFKHLSARIKDLEEKVQMQEERAVPKEYFKKIITKLVNHLTKLTQCTTEDKNWTKPREARYDRYHVHPLLVKDFQPAEKEYDPRPCSSTDQPPKDQTESLWRWGGEILKPGIDLKNKIVVLLEETLQSVRKGWEKNARDDRTIYSRLRPRSRRSESSLVSGRHRGAHKLTPRLVRKRGSFNVAYVNPELGTWEESEISFKLTSGDECEKKDNNYYKKEFLRVIENSRTADRFKLWQSIWNRTLASGQSRNDAVTIQIPDPKDMLHEKTVEVQFTVGEIERLLVGDSATKRTRKV